jgi:curved DNA-binding protein
MSEFIDYYATLGVGKTASQDEIRKAYRKQARKHHPDVNPDDEQAVKRFQALTEANEVLSDPLKRKQYDQYGKDWEHADQIDAMRRQQASAQANARKKSSGQSGQDFSDFFHSIFGDRDFDPQTAGARTQRFKGHDLKTELLLNLEDGLKTHKQTLSVHEQHIRFTVPAGVAPGQTIRLNGHGEPGTHGGPPGDLYITFGFHPHPLFSRKGDDLYARISVDLFTSLLGGELKVPSLEGEMRLQVKPETPSGTKLRLRGKGYPIYKEPEQKGDLILELQVDLPSKLSESEKVLLADWRKIRQERGSHV